MLIRTAIARTALVTTVRRTATTTRSLIHPALPIRMVVDVGRAKTRTIHQEIPEETRHRQTPIVGRTMGTLRHRVRTAEVRIIMITVPAVAAGRATRPPRAQHLRTTAVPAATIMPVPVRTVGEAATRPPMVVKAVGAGVVTVSRAINGSRNPAISNSRSQAISSPLRAKVGVVVAIVLRRSQVIVLLRPAPLHQVVVGHRVVVAVIPAVAVRVGHAKIKAFV